MKRTFFLVIFICSLTLFSQEKQPKIGLVLSGGGAKGFAHIGVLKEIERAGIKLDYIAGTSMGAIVGGLYAAGYSADEIETIILDTDFFNLIRDKIPRRTKTIFEKKHGEKHSITLPVVGGKIGLPQGVSKGQNVLNFLTYLLSPVDGITDFSKLPIPFFCIGTDVETGKEVRLQNGSLALALRASGSFPTLLNPVEIDGKLLIDGGVSNNFPVDIMKEKGIDIIIGVDVQGKLYNKEKILSVVDVLNQITSYQMYEKSSKLIKDVDVYIAPKVTKYSVVAFEESKKILEEGMIAAKLVSSTLDSISKLQNFKRDIPSIAPNNTKFLLNEIEINGNKDYTRAYILGTIKISVGDSINAREVADKIGYLSSTNNFKRVDFIIENNNNGKKLVLNIKENPIKTYIQLGLHYDLLYESGVLINYTHKNLITKNDALTVDLIVGDKPRYNLDYYVDNGFYYSYGFSSRYNRFKTEIEYNSQNVNFINMEYSDFTNTVYIETRFDRKFAFGIGFEHKKVQFSTKTLSTPGNNSLIFDDSNYVNGISYLDIDTYDDKNFPTKGFYLKSKFTWYLWSSDFDNDFRQFSQVKGKLGFAKTFYDALTFEFISEAGFTLGEVDSKDFDFSLGGYNENFINNFVPFYGYNINGLTEQSFLKSTFILRYNIFKKHYVSFLGNYGRAKADLFKDGQLFKDTKSGYAFGYGLNSFFGPVELKYSWSPETKNHFWYFNLGFWF